MTGLPLSVTPSAESVSHGLRAAPLSVLTLGAGWFREAPGGLERMYANLVHHLPGAGVHPRGLVVGSSAVEADTQGQVRAFAPPTASVWSRWRGARHAVQHGLWQASTDLVAAHFALYTFPVLDLVRQHPLVVHFHGPWAWEGQAEAQRARLQVQAKARLEAAVYRRADRLIVLSEAFRAVLCERYGVDSERVVRIAGGVQADRFDTGLTRVEAQQHLGWPTDRPIVLAVRRLVRRMGLELMIEAVRLLRDRVPDVLVLIAGKGPLREDLDRQIQDEGLGDHVRLLGFVPDEDLPVAYRAAQLTVVPTVALEGFGLITLESLASGTPVLVTPVGGLPEAVRPLSEGLVLASATAAAVADGIAGVLCGQRPVPTDEACQAHVRQHHDWPVIAERTAALYREVAR